MMKRSPTPFLVVGSLLIVLSAYRWGIAALAWVAPLPFLLAARLGSGWRDRLIMLAVVTVSSIAQVAKIITAPLPLVLAIPFALPSALSAWVIVQGTEVLRRRTGDWGGAVAFVAFTGISEWLSCTQSPLGLWGTGASTQIDNLLLLQFAAVAGVPGIGMVMALVTATLSVLMARPNGSFDRSIASVVAAFIVAVHVWAAARLDQPAPGASFRVAGIVIDDGPERLAEPAALAANQTLAFDRTRLAASRGAQLVVWNEAAVFVGADAEPEWLLRLSELARQTQVELVAAYAIVRSQQPLQFDNKFVWLSPDGALQSTYRKHHPVPGEPSMRGEEPLVTLTRPFGTVAGAICYDFDFTDTALTYGRLGAGLVALPASDWRGIDPYHSFIARIGAIAGGFSVVRPVRAATSVAFDAYGRTRASMSAFEQNERVMLATLPIEPVATVYSRFGDAPALALSVVTLLVLAALAFPKTRDALSTGRNWRAARE